MQCRVAVFIGRIHIRLGLQKPLNNVQMAVCCAQMQRRIVAHVSCIDTGAALNQHVDDRCLPCLGRPMQQREAMLIALIEVVLCVVQPKSNLEGVPFTNVIYHIVHDSHKPRAELALQINKEIAGHGEARVLQLRPEIRADSCHAADYLN